MVDVSATIEFWTVLPLMLPFLICILRINTLFMRTATTTLLFLTALIILATSCQKEVSFQTGNNSGSSGGTGGNNSTTNIAGDYDFVGMIAHTSSTVTVDEGGIEAKTVTTSDYVTKNNGGTAKFTPTEMDLTDLTYSIDTTMNLKLYQDNQLLDDEELPFVLSSPPTSSSNPYTRITADSITILGALGVASDPTGTAPTGPAGVRLAWSGDTLLLKVNSGFNQTVTQNGVTGVIVGAVIGVIKFKKH